MRSNSRQVHLHGRSTVSSPTKPTAVMQRSTTSPQHRSRFGKAQRGSGIRSTRLPGCLGWRGKSNIRETEQLLRVTFRTHPRSTKNAARTRGPLNATLTEHQHRNLGLGYLLFAAWRRRSTQPRARKAPIEAIVAGSGVAVRAATFTAPMSTANNTSLKSRSPPPSRSSKPRIR